MAAKAVYCLICLAGMWTLWAVISTTVQHLSPDTVYGALYGGAFVMVLALIAQRSGATRSRRDRPPE